jgi:predicted DNA-binding transcriptional regulator YafY
LKGLELLSPLYRYIDNRQTVRVMYQSFKADEPTEIIFYPYLLKEFRNRWFIVGSANDAKKVFNLALDRIVSVEPVDVKYVESPNFDPEHFFDNVIGVSTSIKSYPRRINFWASKEQSNYIKTKPLHHSQKLIQENPDGSCEFQINVVINYELFSMFLSYGAGVKVISPPVVVKWMKEQIEGMKRAYEDIT